VFDAVTATPCPASQLAKQLGVDGAALEKLLNVLVATGYLQFRDGGYLATALSRRWLARDGAGSLHDNMLLRFLEWDIIAATESYVRTGQSLDVHDRIGDDQWGVYQRGMRSLAKLSAPEVAFRVRLAGNADSMLDVGGGHGTYAVAFCRQHPRLMATILDLPQAVASAAPILAEENMGRRVMHRAGNALTEDFGDGQWDLIFMSHFVHHFDAGTNAALLQRAGRALRADGVLAILDVLRPASPTASNQTGALLDLYFAMTSNSGTWSHDEIKGWCRQAGLRPPKRIDLRTAPGLSVVTATKPA
jgi:SAM-dependent methyltransferase